MRPFLRETAKVLLPLALRGSAVTCPICERGFRRFIARGVNLMCPGCGSYERHRFTMLVLREQGLLARPGPVLHLAPDPSLVAPIRAAKGAEYVTGDLRPGPLVDVELDAHALPFEDGSFSLVLCSHVLQQVSDDAQVLRELRRVLGAGGTALLQVPVESEREQTYEDAALTSAGERARAFGQPEGVRMYGGDTARRFGAPGFAVEVLRPEDLPAEDQRRMGLIHGGARRGSDVYCCVAA